MVTKVLKRLSGSAAEKLRPSGGVIAGLVGSF
jgi:hypothetical protein